MSIKISLPIYVEVSKTKKIMVGMNWYRNANYFEQNKVKKYYHSLITKKMGRISTIRLKEYQIYYRYYYKRIQSDLTNITSVIDKFLNDTLQELNIIENDNVKYLKKVVCEVGGQDKENPRLDIEIIGQ